MLTGPKFHDMSTSPYNSLWANDEPTIDHPAEGVTLLRAFCLREGLKDGAFRWWRQALARRDREAPATTQANQDGRPTEKAPAFLPVRLIDLEAVGYFHPCQDRQ